MTHRFEPIGKRICRISGVRGAHRRSMTTIDRDVPSRSEESDSQPNTALEKREARDRSSSNATNALELTQRSGEAAAELLVNTFAELWRAKGRQKRQLRESRGCSVPTDRAHV